MSKRMASKKTLKIESYNLNLVLRYLKSRFVAKSKAVILQILISCIFHGYLYGYLKLSINFLYCYNFV